MFYFEVALLAQNSTLIMGYGFDNFSKSKVPGRTNHGGGSIGLSFSSSAEKALLYVNKRRVWEVEVPSAERLGLGIAKLSMEVFVTVDGALRVTKRVGALGKFFPVLNLGAETKVEAHFEE